MNSNLKNYSKWFLSELKNSICDLFKKEKRVKQLPNMLTLSRAIAPIVVVPVALTGNFVTALVLALSFAATDAVDGLLARKLDSVSEFGKDLDPVCDKLFVAGIVMPIAFIHPTVLAPLTLEGVIAGTNVVSKAKGNAPVTTVAGKVKTVSLSCLLIALYATTSYVINPSLILGLFTVTVALQAYTASDYVRIHLKKESAKKKNNVIYINVPENPEVEEIKKRERNKKVKVLNFEGKKRKLEKAVSKEVVYTTEDYIKLRKTVVTDNEVVIGKQLLLKKPKKDA